MSWGLQNMRRMMRGHVLLCLHEKGDHGKMVLEAVSHCSIKMSVFTQRRGGFTRTCSVNSVLRRSLFTVKLGENQSSTGHSSCKSIFGEVPGLERDPALRCGWRAACREVSTAQKETRGRMPMA